MLRQLRAACSHAFTTCRSHWAAPQVCTICALQLLLAAAATEAPWLVVVQTLPGASALNSVTSSALSPLLAASKCSFSGKSPCASRLAFRNVPLGAVRTQVPAPVGAACCGAGLLRTLLRLRQPSLGTLRSLLKVRTPFGSLLGLLTWLERGSCGRKELPVNPPSRSCYPCLQD